MAGKTNPETGLQEAQERFADEYLIDFNATEAYRRAGYKAKGQAAAAAASRLLTDEKVQAYLAGKKQALLKRTDTDQEATLRRLAHLALGDRRRLFNSDGSLKAMHELSEEDASMIAGIEIVELFIGKGEKREAIGTTKKIKLINGLDAVRALGTHYGMFVKRVEHEHRVPGLAGILEEIGAEGANTGPGRASSR